MLKVEHTITSDVCQRHGVNIRKVTPGLSHYGGLETTGISYAQFTVMYAFIALAQNNFRPTGVSHDDFDDFLALRDIFLLFDSTKSQKIPIGFAIQELYQQKSHETSGLEREFKVAINQPVYFLHSFALEAGNLGRGYGKYFADCVLGLGRERYGQNYTRLLVTGEPNQFEGGAPVLSFYENMGMKIIGEREAHVSEFQARRNYIESRTRTEWLDLMATVFETQPG
ncbi:MAG: hypothetical protein VYA34_08650 [Myxococcota bacterium]|nr:hypothetical protein [Myxococcota bacterium]